MAADSVQGLVARPLSHWLRPLALVLTGAGLALGATLLWAGGSGTPVPSADPYAYGYERFCDQPELGAPGGRMTYGLRVPTGRCLHQAWICRSPSGSCPVPAGYAITRRDGE